MLTFSFPLEKCITKRLVYLLGTHRWNEKEMTITCHKRHFINSTMHNPCFPQVYSFNFARVISWDSYTLLQMMPGHFPACVTGL